MSPGSWVNHIFSTGYSKIFARDKRSRFFWSIFKETKFTLNLIYRSKKPFKKLSFGQKVLNVSIRVNLYGADPNERLPEE
jgi:hypothetical protein